MNIENSLRTLRNRIQTSVTRSVFDRLRAEGVEARPAFLLGCFAGGVASQMPLACAVGIAKAVTGPVGALIIYGAGVALEVRTLRHGVIPEGVQRMAEEVVVLEESEKRAAQGGAPAFN